MKKSTLLIALAMATCLTQSFGQIPLAEEKVIVTNERRINSEELEFSPVFYKDGIVFISTRHESVAQNIKDKNIGGKNIMSIYHSRRDEEGFLQSPEPLAIELIFRLHEGPVSFDRTADYIFFTRNEPVKEAPDGFKKLQIYGAQKMESGVWENLQKLPFNNVDYNYAHPSLSPDGDVMYISSDLPGGYGGMDLYAVFQTDGKWDQLVNLGEEVNSAGNELFPYIAADGTLYFSSDGHGGLGNLDIFYAKKIGQKWTKPVNLQVPFNSPADDLGFIVDRDNKNGYFSSDRKGGFGEDDIYSFYVEGDVAPVAGVTRNLDGLVVLDENGNPVEGADVSAINFDEVSLSAGDERVVKLVPGDGKDNFILDVNSEGMGDMEKTDLQGKAGMVLTPGSYVLKITKDGYVPEYVVVGPDTDLSNLNVTLRRAVDCVALTGRVLMGEGRTPVSGASVQVVDVDTKESVTIYSDDKGNYDYCIKCNRNYTVYAVKNNISSAPGIASTKDMVCSAESKIDLPLYIYGTPLYAGMTIVLPNIYFNFDDAALRPDAYKDLDEVAGMLKNTPGMKLELASHTDARGSNAYNEDLSLRRSLSVFKYLTSKGIAEARLMPRGYGENQIRNRCKDGVKCTEQEHQFNRRTEIKIIELGETEQPGTIAGQEKSEDNLAAVSTETDPENEPNAEKGGQEVLPTEPTAIPEGAAGEGAYAVVAGTFANHDFAVRRSNLLTKLGYKSTNIVKQERNGLYAVWVNTFDLKKEASNLVRQLAQQQLNAYVLRR